MTDITNDTSRGVLLNFEQGIDSIIIRTPAPEIDPVPLLDDVTEFIKRFVALSDAQAHIITVWIAHTHCMAAFSETPSRYTARRSNPVKLVCWKSWSC